MYITSVNSLILEISFSTPSFMLTWESFKVFSTDLFFGLLRKCNIAKIKISAFNKKVFPKRNM